MKRIKRLILGTISVILVILLLFSAMAYAAEPSNLKKPDKEKPVLATNIELVKKVTAKGRPGHSPPGKPDKERGGNGGAATGILGEQYEGSKYAIVIGISEYPDPDDNLLYCDDDAIDMEEALKDIYGFTNVKTLLNAQATRQAILDAIESLELIKDADEIVFFFSGHGTRGIAADWDKESVDEAICVWSNDGESMTYIWDGELELAFREFTTSRIIFIFDTCLAGGMKNDLEAPGRVICMASTENGYSYELPWLGNGEFTYYLVEEGIINSEADSYDHDGDPSTNDVTVEEAYDYAKSRCSYDKPTIGDFFVNDLLP